MSRSPFTVFWRKVALSPDRPISVPVDWSANAVEDTISVVATPATMASVRLICPASLIRVFVFVVGIERFKLFMDSKRTVIRSASKQLLLIHGLLNRLVTDELRMTPG